MATRTTKRRVPPSRLRYEERNPNISMRLPKDVHNQLEEVRKATGQSWADLMKVALEIQKPVMTRKPNQIELDKAFEEGWHEAHDSNAITYPCSKCGGPVTITSDNEIRAIRQYIKGLGWGHPQCPPGDG